MNPGKMISIEGVEGVGKSTLIPIVAQEVEAEGYSVIMTREPGGTEIGERVRDLLLHEHDSNIAPVTELSLMFAARAQHLEAADALDGQEEATAWCAPVLDDARAHAVRRHEWRAIGGTDHAKRLIQPRVRQRSPGMPIFTHAATSGQC